MTTWVIVGGGSAGCVVAARLSEDPGNDVTVLEAGPDHGLAPVPDDHGTLDRASGRLFPRAAVVRRVGTLPTDYLQGYGLGGSSLVNGGVVIAESDIADPRAGHQLPLEAPSRLGALGGALFASAHDAQTVLLARRAGVRVTAADAYLRPAMARPNLHVIAEAEVARVVIDKRRAVGVTTMDGADHPADRVVLCAGAIRTPTLLLRSGVAVPGIGVGLQDQPAVFLPVELETDSVDPSAPQITASIDRRIRSGGQILGLNHIGAPGFGALMAGLTRVASVGRVTLPDQDGDPVVDLCQLSNERDADRLAVIVAQAIALLDLPAMREVVTAAYLDDHGTPVMSLRRDVVAIREWLPGQLAGYHHVSASCRRGVVTDDDGAVVGHSGLKICDASLFRGVPSANLYLHTIRLAEELVGRWRRAG